MRSTEKPRPLTRPLNGRLSDQRAVIQQAKRRAQEVSEATPVKEYVDAEHWVFKIPRKRPTG
ncbi:MAG: hypothetical protein QOH06_4119 [Acidobacteriota bacterium]|jgi:uncharacterized Zn finger protein|nr:hypothetical protein [Acidobacteriota bacterium]